MTHAKTSTLAFITPDLPRPPGASYAYVMFGGDFNLALWQDNVHQYTGRADNHQHKSPCQTGDYQTIASYFLTKETVL